LTGAQPSSVRAGIMGSLVLLALFSGRLSDPKNAILCAASFMILINPKVLKYDIGFQLSFLATIGIIYLSPFLKKILKFIPNTFKFREMVMMTISAQILTLPIIIYNFERLSLIAPLANVMVVPLVPLIMTSGLLVGISGMVWIVLGKIFSFVSWALLSYEIFVVNMLSKVPFASLEIEKIWQGWIIIYYAVIIYIIWYLRMKDRKKLQINAKNKN
jgi:competence protein ComEC